MVRDKILDKNKKEINLDVLLHPGDVLANELESRKLTKGAFTIKCGMYPL